MGVLLLFLPLFWMRWKVRLIIYASFVILAQLSCYQEERALQAEADAILATGKQFAPDDQIVRRDHRRHEWDCWMTVWGDGTLYGSD